MSRTSSTLELQTEGVEGAGPDPPGAEPRSPGWESALGCTQTGIVSVFQAELSGAELLGLIRSPLCHGEGGEEVELERRFSWGVQP